MIRIPLRGGEDYCIDETEQRSYVDAYPKIDVLSELNKMSQWCRANPNRRKTARGIKRFITAWLNRVPEKQIKTVTFAAAHKPFEPEPEKKITKSVGLAALAALKR